MNWHPILAGLLICFLAQPAMWVWELMQVKGKIVLYVADIVSNKLVRLNNVIIDNNTFTSFLQMLD